jgi:hypothetical protein
MNRDKIYFNSRIVILALLASLLLTSSVMAHTHWHQGTVTKAPWQKHYRYIIIDNTLYTFMPKATFCQRLKNRRGDYNEKKLHWLQIREGQKVLIDIQGRRIYQLIIQK